MKKILIAEDDKFLANAYRVKFSKFGFDVKIVFDGQEALTVLQTFIPDIILLDLVMPIKDGFSTLEDIKKIELLKNIPIIVASNLGQKEDMDKALAMGANDFIIKSDLSLDDLIQKVTTLLSKPA